MAVDPTTDIIGDMGTYQIIVVILILFSKPPIAFHQMAIIFLAPKVSYTCNNIEKYCPCPNPVYNKSIFTNTIVMEWNLICEKRWMVSFTQTIFQLGTLFGSIFFGMLSDKFGRKNPLFVVVILQLASGIGASFMPEYWSFTIMRFIIGLSVGGSMMIAFVYCMEYIGTKYRELFSAIYQVAFNLGHILLPVLSFFIRDYKYFQLTISCSALFMLLYFIFFYETPRWLLAMNKTDTAIFVLKKIAKRNKRPTDNIDSLVRAYQDQLEVGPVLKKGTVLDIFRTPNIRRNTICMSLNWMACGFCFYGISQYVGHLSGNVFINVASSATVTLLGTICSIPLMKVIGRKLILIVSNYTCVICLLILAVIPPGVGRVILACIGLVAVFIVFVLVYLYTAELFPTVIRNTAIGFCSMIARVGSMIAPFVVALHETAEWLPPIIFALLPLLAGSVAFFLPETKGSPLIMTIEEGENLGKKPKKSSRIFRRRSAPPLPPPPPPPAPPSPPPSLPKTPSPTPPPTPTSEASPTPTHTPAPTPPPALTPPSSPSPPRSPPSSSPRSPPSNR